MTAKDTYPVVIVDSQNGEVFEWDVSGSHAFELVQRKSNSRDFGEDGVGGLAGESGGNVRIEAADVLHGDNWIIKTNGGNGSNGQNGARGSDGKVVNPECFGVENWFKENDAAAVETKFTEIAKSLTSKISVIEACEGDKFFKKSFTDKRGVSYTLVKGESPVKFVSIWMVLNFHISINPTVYLLYFIHRLGNY